MSRFTTFASLTFLLTTSTPLLAQYCQHPYPYCEFQYIFFKGAPAPSDKNHTLASMSNDMDKPEGLLGVFVLAQNVDVVNNGAPPPWGQIHLPMKLPEVSGFCLNEYLVQVYLAPSLGSSRPFPYANPWGCLMGGFVPEHVFTQLRNDDAYIKCLANSTGDTHSCPLGSSTSRQTNNSAASQKNTETKKLEHPASTLNGH